MRDRSYALRHIARALFAAAILAAAGPAVGATPVVQPPFADDYTLVALGEIPGVHAPYGALNFELGATDQVIVGGWSGTTNGSRLCSHLSATLRPSPTTTF